MATVPAAAAAAAAVTSLGHVLISPIRVVRRFADLTQEEVADLWGLAQLVGKTLEPHYKAASLTLAIQVGSVSTMG
jgi:bis(5'-adenosyl)-triphosphatase